LPAYAGFKALFKSVRTAAAGTDFLPAYAVVNFVVMKQMQTDTILQLSS